MPRGRPKKSQIISNTNIFEITETSKVEEKPIETKTEKTIYKWTTYCELCNKQINCSPFVIRLNSLSGLANYYRNCKIDKLKICRECAEEFNSVIDNWILKKNKNLNKFKLD